MVDKFVNKLVKLADGDESVVEGTENIGGVEIPMITAPRMSQEVLEAVEYAPGYSQETVLVTPCDGSESFNMDQVVANAGGCVGNLKDAAYLIKKKGIAPQLAPRNQKTCSIGFCKREQKWYGWSHRAIYGFGIGDVAKDGDCATTSGWTEEYLAEHPEEDLSLPVGFEAKTLDDAKRMAIAFAESVG